jgi:hypothetical protein
MAHWIGIALVVVPLLIFGAVALNRQAFVLLLVLLAAGIGYYTYTGEIVGIGLSIVSSLRDMFGIDMGQMLPK